MISRPVLCERRAGQPDNINFVRLILAVMVVFSHSFPVLWFDNRHEWAMRLTRGQDTSGSLAVNAFFALSGFLIVQSWANSRSTADYLKKRLLRICPAFFAASVVCAFVVGPLGADDPGEYLSRLLGPGLISFIGHTITLNYPHVPPIFLSLPHHAVNNSMWTIRYEFWCYLMVALIGVVGLIRRPRAVLALALAMLAANAAQEIYASLHGFNADTFTGLAQGRELPLIGRLDYWPRFAAYFLMGGVFTIYSGVIPRSRRLLAVCLASIAVCALAGAGLNVLLPICGTYSLFYAAFSRRQVGAWITRRGDFSYGIYLYAWPVQQLVAAHWGLNLGPHTLFAVALPLTVPLAAASWFCVERPFLRLKPKPKVRYPLIKPTRKPVDEASLAVEAGRPSRMP